MPDADNRCLAARRSPQDRFHAGRGTVRTRPDDLRRRAPTATSRDRGRQSVASHLEVVLELVLAFGSGADQLDAERIGNGGPGGQADRSAATEFHAADHRRRNAGPIGNLGLVSTRCRSRAPDPISQHSGHELADVRHVPSLAGSPSLGLDGRSSSAHPLARHSPGEIGDRESTRRPARSAGRPTRSAGRPPERGGRPISGAADQISGAAGGSTSTRRRAVTPISPHECRASHRTPLMPSRS